MKILLIANGYPPDRWAGTETYTAAIAEGLSKRGHDVRVICAGKWRTGSKNFNGFVDVVYHGIPVRKLNLNWKKATSPFRYLYNNPIIADQMRLYLDALQPDLVHITSCETLSASIIPVIKKAGYSLVLSLTDFWFLCPRINLLKSDGSNCDGITSPWDCLKCQLLNSKVYRLTSQLLPGERASELLMYVSKYPLLTRMRGLRGMAGDMQKRKSYLRRALDLADIRITASPFVQGVFLANGVESPIRVQAYGHDLGWLKKYSGKVTSDRIRIGYIGQISKSKGVHLLLEAARTLTDDLAGRFIIKVYGNIDHNLEYSQYLRSIVSDPDIVDFCGTYHHDRSAEIFEAIDILVVPSLWFDFPLVIFEAFATTTPVIATNLGGMAESISHDVNGLLFARGNIDDLAKQIRRVIENPRVLERLRAGILPVKQIEEELDELEDIYRHLVSGD